jgi:hypothetical protein
VKSAEDWREQFRGGISLEAIRDIQAETLAWAYNQFDHCQSRQGCKKIMKVLLPLSQTIHAEWNEQCRAKHKPRP